MASKQFRTGIVRVIAVSHYFKAKQGLVGQHASWRHSRDHVLSVVAMVAGRWIFRMDRLELVHRLALGLAVLGEAS
jgi:hypothetical protein